MRTLSIFKSNLLHTKYLEHSCGLLICIFSTAEHWGENWTQPLMLFSKCYFLIWCICIKKSIGQHVLIINHLIYYVNKRTLDVTVGGYCVGERIQYLQEVWCQPTCPHFHSQRFGIQMSSEVFRVELQLLFDPVLHQKTDVGVCYGKTVTHVHLLICLLCWKTNILRLDSMINIMVLYSLQSLSHHSLISTDTWLSMFTVKSIIIWPLKQIFSISLMLPTGDYFLLWLFKKLRLPLGSSHALGQNKTPSNGVHHDRWFQ